MAPSDPLYPLIDFGGRARSDKSAMRGVATLPAEGTTVEQLVGAMTGALDFSTVDSKEGAA